MTLPLRARRRFRARHLRLERLESRTLLAADPALGSVSLPVLQIDPDDYSPTNLLVRFRDEAGFRVEAAQSVQDRAILGATRIGRTLGLVPGLREIQLTPGVGLEAALAAYRAHPQVLYAEPDYRVRIATTPNDPRAGEMWPLENTGQTGGTADVDVDAYRAWDVTTGSGDTLLAVIDTGIDYTHPDLADNIWVNPGEIPGDGIDNDGNGYVDDVHGYDFANDDGDPMDDQGHGTHVAGTIGAVGDNSLGVVGLNWDVQIMALKFLKGDGTGDSSDAIEAIRYAVANGAVISNNSWGGAGYSQAMFDAIAEARDAGHLFVAAAGNGNEYGIGQDNDATGFYPAGYDLDNVLAVAATDHNDDLAGFSNYGATTVDLAAPGVDILSTLVGGGYGKYSGTSMATPHVTGVAALVHDLHPDWSAPQLITQLLGTVEPVPTLYGVTVTGGRLNAAAAVGNPEPVTPPATSSLPVLAEFSAGQSSPLQPRVGDWDLDNGRWTTAPVAEDHDLIAVSTLNPGEPLPANVDIQATIQAEQGSLIVFGIVIKNDLTNGFVAFDYHGPEDFKFAGLDVDAGRWVLGHRSGTNWIVDAWANDSLLADSDYRVRLRIENDNAVTLLASDVQKLTRQYGESVTDGSVGMAAKASTTQFDNVLIQPYLVPVPADLPFSEDFSAGAAENLDRRDGLWSLSDGRFAVHPLLDQDGVSTLATRDPLPAETEIRATINADDVTPGRFSNAFVIFDYQSPTDFKFAGGYVASDQWLIGRRTASGWSTDSVLSEPIEPLMDYDLQVVLHADGRAILTVDGIEKVSHPYGDLLTDGAAGIGTRDALARFDNLLIQAYVPPPPPPATNLPVDENFNDGAADYFSVQAGVWTVENGRYAVRPVLDQDGISLLRIVSPLPSELDIRATINADDVTPNRFSNAFVIFDYQGPDDFKFAGSYVASDQWLIGRRTSSGWITDAMVSAPVDPLTDYDLQLILRADGGVSLAADGREKVVHQYADSLTDGSVGLGTRDALARFDDVRVQVYVPPPPPPTTTLPVDEDFNDGVADYFEVQSGTWTVAAGRYEVVPVLDQDGVSTLRIQMPMPADLDIRTTVNADDATSDRFSNAFVIFDYQSPTDFKFAGGYVASDQWLIGRRTSSGWITDSKVSAPIAPYMDYDLQVVLQSGGRVSLVVDGQEQVVHQYAGSLTDGAVGIGTRDAISRFDDVLVQPYVPPPPPPTATLPLYENFDDGVADFFDVQAGTWTVDAGRYEVAPVLDQDGVSTLRIASPLPADLQIQATINADDVTPGRFSNAFVIFDYQGPTNFRFAGAYVASNQWLIGRRTTSGWITDTKISESISPWTDYRLQVDLKSGGLVRLFVNGQQKLQRQYSDNLTDGAVGVGTRDAFARFDDIVVQTLPGANSTLSLSTVSQTGLTEVSKAPGTATPSPGSEPASRTIPPYAALPRAETDRVRAVDTILSQTQLDLDWLLADPLLDFALSAGPIPNL